MIKHLLLALSIAAFITALPDEDRVSSPPGMIGAVVYSGYLDTATAGRKLHYVFIQANVTDPANAPLAIWLNGGPGCSSLCGMIQQIGPFLVGNSYKQGDLLTKNEFSWNKAANLLFLESPASVGFSYEKNQDYPWTDLQTAKDAFEAIKQFIFTKAPQFATRPLFITGQSYAGKYIPDITVQIIEHNRNKQYINITGIMVGNGVMSFENDQLEKSQIQYMIDHALISDRMELIYRQSCFKDFESPRCRFFRYEFDIVLAYLNQYDIYETCQTKSSQAIRLKEALSPWKTYKSEGKIYQKEGRNLGQIPECPSDDGATQYWNLNKLAFKTDTYGRKWSVCTDINYAISERGSMDEYRKIISNGGVKVWLFSGDWDDVVPYTDTEKNVEQFRRQKVGDWNLWNVGDQHAGFYQIYDKLTVITVKGAGHMVPVTKGKGSYQLFYNFVNNKGVNNQIF